MNDTSIFGLSPMKSNIPEKNFTVTPLGGFGQIGMNCMVWSCNDCKVIVDCGLMFPSDFHLGVDVIIPRFDFIFENKEKIAGIILTHGHEDHIGALPWLVPYLSVPIYGSEFTLALVENKLRERNLLGRCDLVKISDKKPLKLGDMTFNFFPVCHSIIDGYAIGAETPAGKIIHTGDFKIEKNPISGPGTDLKVFKDFAGKDGVKLLFSDSTNIESEGSSLSEKEVFDNLRNIFKEAKNRIIVTLFSSHIQRIQEIFDCAKETGRIVGVSGRSLMNNIETAARLNRLRVPDNVYLGSKNMPECPDNKVVLLVTGSQGESLSALARIASGGHRDFNIHEGDVVILSSRLIPGNTVAVNSMVNQLYRSGAEVYFDREHPVHASGHAHQEELEAMLEATRPEFFVPVHGEYRHLVKHARLARDCGVEKNKSMIIENGTPFSIDSSGLTLEPDIAAGGVLVDGKGVGDVGQAVLKERHLLGGAGMVIVFMVLDKETGSILHGPDITSKGFIFEQHYDHVLEDAKCLVLDAVEEIWDGEDLEKLKDHVRLALRRFFRRVLDRDPIVIPGIMSV